MTFTAVDIILEPFNTEYADILYAYLDSYNYVGVHDQENLIKAYIPSHSFSESALSDIQNLMLAAGCKMKWWSVEVPDQNWNRIWEENFEPVIIGTNCVIRASFHGSFDHITYCITVEPKMAFGTGHHATTRLMMEQMLQMDLKGKSVLDMGSGTGILSVLASKMGASEVIAFDNDETAFKSTIENASLNNCNNIKAFHSGEGNIPDMKFDIILANINRNTLMKMMHLFSLRTYYKSHILLSGFLWMIV